MTSPNETQIGGTHYKDMAVQPWDAMRAWMSFEQFRGFLLGNVIKYCARHDLKGGVEDLRKARHYLDKLIEIDSREEIANAIDDDDMHAVHEVLEKKGWPGPDWSQAPEWAKWWAKDSDMPNAIWWRDQPERNEKGYWTMRNLHHHGFAYVNAPHFNYPGHWRDSLRERPKAAPLNPPRPNVPATGHDTWTYLGVYQDGCGTKAHAWKRLSDAKFFGVWQESGNTFMFSCLQGPEHDPSWKPCLP